MSVEDIKQNNPFVWVNRHGSNKRDKEHKMDSQMDSQTDTMISKQEVYRIRLKPFVERKVADSKIYLEKFNQEGWIEYLITTMGSIPLEQFITIADDDLKGRIGRLMSLQLVAGILNDFTPEQMKIFDECMIRR